VYGIGYCPDVHIKEGNSRHWLTNYRQLPGKTVSCSVLSTNYPLSEEFGISQTYLVGRLYLYDASLYNHFGWALFIIAGSIHTICNPLLSLITFCVTTHLMSLCKSMIQWFKANIFLY